MFTGILATNGGAHSVEDWAAASAAAFVRAFEVKPESTQYGQIEQAKTRLQRAVERIMEKHHQEVQDGERSILAEAATSGDHSRLTEALDANEHTEIDEAVAEIREACTPLLSILKSAEVISTLTGSNVEHLTFEEHLMRVIRERVSMDLHTSMHIERSWHADNHPDTEHAEAFRQAAVARGDDNLLAVVDESDSPITSA